MIPRRSLLMALAASAGLLCGAWAVRSASAGLPPAAPPPACDEAAVNAALPLDLTIVPPAADVPAALAGLSGVWCEPSPDGDFTVLAVETVTPPTARVVYASGSTVDPRRGNFWRAEASFSGDMLVAKPYPGLVLSATLRPDDTLELGYGLETVAGTLALRRVPHATEEPSREFVGLYYTMFEVESFTEGPDCAGQGEAAWLEAAPGSGFYEATRAYRAAHPDEFRQAPFGRYLVRFIGHLSPPGPYGHLGGYRRQVTVERVLEVASCPAP